MAKVAVVIPAYNPQPGQLERAIDSVRRQTFDDWVCVIVDDGSEPRIAPQLDDSHHEIILLRQDNTGVAAARNNGVNLVSSEYIAFLDQDDEWLPNKLVRQLSFMQLHNLSMCDTEFSWVRNGRASPGFAYHEGDFIKLFSNARIGLSTMLLRHDVFTAFGGFDESFHVASDWDLELRVASSGLKFDRLREILTLTHMHGHNASSDYRVMCSEQLAILRRYSKDSRPPVRTAASLGHDEISVLCACLAIEAFRLTREPGDIVWAARQSPTIVLKSIIAKTKKTVGRKSSV